MSGNYETIDGYVKEFISTAFKDNNKLLVINIFNTLKNPELLEDALYNIIVTDRSDMDDKSCMAIITIKKIVNSELLKYSLLLEPKASLRVYKNTLFMVDNILSLNRGELETILSNDIYDAMDVATELYGLVATEDKYDFYKNIRSIGDDFISELKETLKSVTIYDIAANYRSIVTILPWLKDTLLYKYVIKEGIEGPSYSDLSEYIYSLFINNNLTQEDFINNITFLLLTASDTKDNYKHSLYDTTVEDLKEYGIDSKIIDVIVAGVNGKFKTFNGVNDD